MTLTDELKIIRDKYMGQIHEMPFVMNLAAGQLTQAQRDYYIAQDHYYVETFTKYSTRVYNQLIMQGYQLPGMLSDESDAHAALQANPENIAQIKPGQHNESYLAHMAEQTSQGDVLAGVLSLLPCVESYYLIAKAGLDTGEVNTNYRAWFDFYTSKKYHDWVVLYWQVLNDYLANPQQRTLTDFSYVDIYVKSYQHEIAFWQKAADAAY
ncbi:TenA family protein [Weissella ceti]|uniref:Aminopyrimidine aminohydrolase n=1 Tax=Weissella ceti TaxID=759620 RepID=A0ABT3E401_9LACO|nr:TenA family protein [Weissella ceti]MCW0953148.1 TenA family protein [Weissella ceti]QVK12668.1 TenA family protein [Weissella ceti]